jgi:hypothetical protein
MIVQDPRSSILGGNFVKYITRAYTNILAQPIEGKTSHKLIKILEQNHSAKTEKSLVDTGVIWKQAHGSQNKQTADNGSTKRKQQKRETV